MSQDSQSQSQPLNEQQLSLLNEEEYRTVLREGRVTARDCFASFRRNCYEKVFFDKGGNSIGIARGTNAIYGEVFPGGRPDGNLDGWEVDEQEDIMIAEIAARREVRTEQEKQPDESQREVKARLVQASKNGASKAKGFLGWLSS